MDFFEANLGILVTKMRTKYSRIGNIMLQNDLSWMHQFHSINRKRSPQEKQDAQSNMIKMYRDRFKTEESDNEDEENKHESFKTLFQSERILPQFKQITSSQSGYLEEIKAKEGLDRSKSNDYLLSQSASFSQPYKSLNMNKKSFDPYSLNTIMDRKMKNLKSGSYSFNSVSRDKLNSISMAEKVEIPGANRYNPNYRALKPRSIGMVIKPITRTSHLYKPKEKERKFLLQKIRLSLKNRQNLRKKRYISMNARKVFGKKDFSLKGLNNLKKPLLLNKLRIKRRLRVSKPKASKNFFENT